MQHHPLPERAEGIITSDAKPLALPPLLGYQWNWTGKPTSLAPQVTDKTENIKYGFHYAWPRHQNRDSPWLHYNHTSKSELSLESGCKKKINK